MPNESEQRYRKLQETDAFLRVDLTGRIQEFNLAFLNMIGYSEEELRRLMHADITPEQWHESEAHIVRDQVLQRGYSDVYEKEYRRKDGTVFPVELRSFLLRDNRGEPGAIWAVVLDITERRQREQAVRESEERLSLAAEAGNLGFYSYEAASGRVYCSPEVLALYGLPPSASLELDDSFVPEALYPEDKARFRAYLVAASDPRGSGILDVEYRIIRTDGQIRWLRAHGRSVFSGDRVARSYGIVQDITERKRAEDALRASEERFRQVAEAVSNFIWEVDPNGLYLYTSPSIENILGYTPDELIGKKHFYDLFAPETREQLKIAAFQAFAARQRFDKFRNSNVSKSGRIVHLETSGVPIVTETGQFLGYRGADTDITERLQAERETQLLRQELALFSRVGTLSELTASLAHELNQPLAAILANAQAALRLMERGTLDPDELRAIFTDIVADDQRAAEVIRGMRSMLRTGVAERQPLVLNDLIKEVIPIVRNDALIRNVGIDLDLGLSLPVIKGNRVQLQQVVLNLIVNAFEAMNSSGPPGKVILRTREADGEVVLDVVDSGTGIAPDKLNSIFDPFITTKAEGLGMGLSLSRSIAIGHNGRLWAENNRDGGATFHLALPMENGVRQAPNGDVDRSPQSEARRPGQGLTVLIADDKESFRRAVCSILRELPELKLVVEAQDGAQAVEKAAELNPDLILLDVSLPTVNGVEAAARIHTIAPNAKVVFLTQHDSPDFVMAAMRAGALGYVLKVDAGNELLQAAMAAFRGEQYLSSGIRRSALGGA